MLLGCAAKVAADMDGAATLDDPAAFVNTAVFLAVLALDVMLCSTGAQLAAKVTASAPSGTEPPQQPQNMFDSVGSEAAIVLVDCGGPGSADGAPPARRARRITVASCGVSSRLLLCRGGTVVELLSQDHEEPRLGNAASSVSSTTGGNANTVGNDSGGGSEGGGSDGGGAGGGESRDKASDLVRVLGDFRLKGRSDGAAEATAAPELRTLIVGEEDEFLVIASNGIFELHSPSSVVRIVRKGLQDGLAVRDVVELLVDASCSKDLALSQGKGGGSCSAVVVLLQ
eukprot:NODE_4653_length_1865_cov_4.207135.p1 GENE.NODE_4653_length_1865_cov_4.207135~~NODE_4653_length_1865_cov_4.207135.p1  ORF type:complete len:285 (-),score=112.81 NODE_4653_length_1865_cov_4.207135:274-1128(-)